MQIGITMRICTGVAFFYFVLVTQEIPKLCGMQKI